ncbi:hypothetical protein P23_3720 [Acinetobacter calcoaceticus]|nr:hypothetical protein P23_3720 [Acinetobacter calcoaceticus]
MIYYFLNLKDKKSDPKIAFLQNQKYLEGHICC